MSWAADTYEKHVCPSDSVTCVRGSRSASVIDRVILRVESSSAHALTYAY